MSTKGVLILLTAFLLDLCQVPKMPVLAAGTPLLGKGSRPSKVRIVARMYDLQHCKDKTHSLIVKNYSNHLEKGGAEYLDIDYDLTTTARRLIALRYILHRCPIGVAGKCEYYVTRSWNMPVCKLLTSKGMVWTPMIQNLYPRFSCPLSKGSYVGRNMTSDVALYGLILETLNVYQYSWPTEIQIDSEEGLYICLTGVGEARKVVVKE